MRGQVMFTVSLWRPLGEREHLFTFFIAALCATTCSSTSSQHNFHELIRCTNYDDLSLAETSDQNVTTNDTLVESSKPQPNYSGKQDERHQDGTSNYPNFVQSANPESSFYSLDEFIPKIAEHPHLKLPERSSRPVSGFTSKHHQQQERHSLPAHRYPHEYSPEQFLSPPVRSLPSLSDEQVVLQQYVTPIEVSSSPPLDDKLMKQVGHQLHLTSQHHNAMQPSKEIEHPEPVKVPEERPPPKAQKPAKKKVTRLKIMPIFRPSVVGRKRLPVNLSSMLKPGEVILAEKATSGARTNSALGPVKADEIVNMLQRLQSFSVKENEKPKSEDSDDQDDGYDIDKDEKSQKERKLERILPTAHLFGSVGSVNEKNLNSGRLSNEDDDDDDEDDRKSDEQRKQAEASEDLLFLKSLADLGSRLKDSKQQDLELRPLDADYYDRKDRDGSKYDARASSEYKRLSEAPNAIPIDVLVDHLMSSSRLASFGVQHTGVHDPNNADGGAGGGGGSPEDDEDDEEEEEEEDDNGAIPSEEEAESIIHETKLEPNKSSISFDAVLNRSDTWIPLDSIAVKSKQLLKEDGSFNKGDGLNVKKGKKRKKKGKNKKKKKRKKRGNGELVLVIGDKVLSRRDLIRLIKVLNKMASQREPTKEREASRRLLRFLVKLALEEYRKNESSKANSEKNDPIREVLRSVLMGPVYSKDSSTERDGLIQLKSLPEGKKESDEIEKEFAGSEVGGSEKGDKSDEEGASTSKQARNPSNKKLDQLSDDLELYFESDFFEELADKEKDKKFENKTIPPRTRKLRRASRAGYSLRVPIYGKQLIEAADEDDVELDHVRIKPKQQVRKLSAKRRSLRRKPLPVEEEEDSKTSKQVVDRKKQNDEEAPEEEDPEEQSASEEEKAAPRRRMAPDQSAQSKSEKGGSYDDAEEPVDSVDDDDDDQEASTEAEIPDKLTNDESEDDQSQGTSKKKVRRRRRRRRQRGPKAHNEPGIHPYDRYEIPAPILAGKPDHIIVRRPVRMEKKPIESTNSTDARSLKTIKKKSIKDSPKKKEKKNNKKSPKGKEKSKSKGKVKKAQVKPVTKKATGDEKKEIKKEATKKDRSRRERPDRGENKTKRVKDPDEEGFRDDEIDPTPAELGEPKEPPRDSDYFNEGTSYSKICEDDGQCKVSLRSSSPKLSKAIKARDKSTIVKHLGKWMAKGD